MVNSRNSLTVSRYCLALATLAAAALMAAGIGLYFSNQLPLNCMVASWIIAALLYFYFFGKHHSLEQHLNEVAETARAETLKAELDSFLDEQDRQAQLLDSYSVKVLLVTDSRTATVQLVDGHEKLFWNVSLYQRTHFSQLKPGDILTLGYRSLSSTQREQHFSGWDRQKCRFTAQKDYAIFLEFLTWTVSQPRPVAA